MANDLINPWQQFKDDRNSPLAGGKLYIYVNRTNTIGTAYSDTDLTVPQSVNPYTLDAFGRVQGDLRWQGVRSVGVYDSNDAHIRTLNDVVTVVDTSDFAINHVSVAAMVADATLEIGDVVETQSYNADQGNGGARYLIVANATGTDDGFLFHDLANTLQAQLLDTETKNFYLAGAVGDGATDDSVAMQAVLTQAGDIHVPGGTFYGEGLTLSADARLHGQGTMKAVQFTTSDFLTLTGANLEITFDGITLDFDEANQTAEQAFTTIDSQITATTRALIAFNNVTFVNGGKYDVQLTGNDAAVGPVYQFSECRFLSGQEATATPYTAAYVRCEDGANLQMENCYYDLETTPAVVGGRGGVDFGRSGAALSNPGYCSVSSSTFNRVGCNADATEIIGAIKISDAREIIVVDNRLQSPQSAGIQLDANVDQITISENQIDGLTGTNVLGQIVMAATADAAPGNNWKIENNQCLDSTSYGITVAGASAGVDAKWIEINGNMVVGAAAAAIHFHDIEDAKIDGNFIDMSLVDGINGIEVGANGVAGNINIEGNSVLNCLNADAINAVAASASAIYTIDGNVIEGTAANSMDGINVTACQDAYVVNNVLVEILGDLITVGDAVTGISGVAVLSRNSYSGTDPTSWAQNDGNITSLLVERNQWPAVDASIDTIAAAATITVTFDFIKLTGTTAIDTITPSFSKVGGELTLFGSDANTRNVTELGNCQLGAATRAVGQNDILRLVYDGTNWNEVAWAVN